MIACVLANINRAPDSEAFDIRDFMPLTQKDREKLEAEKIRGSQVKFAAAFRSVVGKTK